MLRHGIYLGLIIYLRDEVLQLFVPCPVELGCFLGPLTRFILPSPKDLETPREFSNLFGTF